jgi:hypothetical protein
MELAKILFEISDLEPDMIIMYNGGNDILQPWSWDPRPGYPFNFIAYENHPLLDKDLKSYPTIALLAYGSNIMRYLFRSYFVKKFIPLEEVRKKSKYRSVEWKEKIAKIYVNNLIKADKISKAFGANFIAFYQPMLYFKEVSSVSDEEKSYFRKGGGRGKFAREMRKIIIDRIEKARREYGIEIVDLSSIFESESNWIFTDMIHIKQEAKQIVAQAIYDNIIKVIKKLSD